MSSQEPLVDLLLRYEERRQQGQSPTPEEMCHDQPQLLDEFKRRLAYRQRASLVLSAETLSASTPRPSSSDSAQAPPAGHPSPAREFPKVPGYEIVGELGRGGMGVVYKAHHLKLDRVVALKMILAGAQAGPDELARFKTEAVAVARLQHPNIVQIFEVGEHDGLPFFSLELCVGGSLASMLDGTPLPAGEAAHVVEVLARAMHAAHERKIIHRDLKPGNILLQKDEGGRTKDKSDSSFIPHPSSFLLKISDFGLAKKLDDVGQTHTGDIVGTPSYMAPEQADGKTQDIGPATDIYALGAILYQLLTGRPPFRGPTKLDTILQVIGSEPVPPSQLNPKTPRDVETICLKCLAKTPARRYETADALAGDLRRFLAGEPILARPVGTVERLWRWCRRKPGLAIASSAAILAGLLALVTFAVAFFLIRESRDEAVQSGEEKERQRIKADERRKKAEMLTVQVKFEQAFQQPLENRAIGMLSTAELLREPIVLENPPLRDSLALHLGSWLEQVHRLKCVFSHNGSIRAFSPDGKTVLTGSNDKTAQLWDTATAKPLGPPMQHQAAVLAVAFSPDGKIVLTGGFDGNARLWETATGKPLGPPLQHQAMVSVVAFSPDGKTVLTASGDLIVFRRGGQARSEVRLWEIATGKALGPPLQHEDWVGAVAFSPDGNTVLTGSRDKTARLWETATGKPLGPPLQHQARVRAVAFSPDGKTVLTGSGDDLREEGARGEARLWETATGKPLGPPFHHQVMVVAFSPDGKTVLTGSYDWTARLWETATAKPLAPPLHHQSYVPAIAFSPDGKTVLTGSSDKTARLWETATGKPLGPPLQHEGGVDAVALSPDGKTMLTGSWGRTATVRLWEIARDQPLGPPLEHQSGVGAVAFSPDGKSVLTGSSDKTARLWETATGKPLGPPLQHQDGVSAVAFSPDGKTVLTGSYDKTARLWETPKGKALGPALQHKDRVEAVAFSPDGKSVLTGSHDETARLWETATGKPLGPPLQHQAIVWAVAFSPDGKSVLTGSYNGTARLWETATCKPLGPALQHKHVVYAVAFSPDGKTALTGSYDGTARLWETDTGKPLGPPLRHQDGVSPVAFSPDGKILLTGGLDGNARLWETATGSPLGPPLQHQATVWAVAFSPDGKTVLTGSFDGTARLWETATGRPLGPPLQHQNAVRSVAFSPDGKTVLTGSHDNTARLWHVPTPVAGDGERIQLWIQVITGMELDDHGVAHVLDADTWQERRQRLEARGGSPFEAIPR